MSLYHRIALYLFPITLFCLAVYSFALLDPNLTLFNSDIWTSFRNTMVELGYHQRVVSTYIYILLISLLYLNYFILVTWAKKISLKYVGILLGIYTICSYPFLSHDFFNYMFDAKIFTYYHMNPYVHKALDFPWDEWLRFMHWTHRTYPYGPTFLPLSFIPSFISFGKLLLNMIFFKIFFFGIFWVSVVLLSRVNKKWAMLYALNPLVIIEGLVNGHNDIVGLSLAIIGFYFIYENNRVWGRVVMLISGGIKYITAPLVIVTKKESMVTKVALGIVLCMLAYVSLYSEVQGWYFLVLFAFLPYYERLLWQGNIIFAGLLLGYYPFVLEANWTVQAVERKHIVIIMSIIVFVLLSFKNIVFKHVKSRS